MIEYKVNPNPKVLMAFRQKPKFRISLVKTSNIIGKIFFHVLMDSYNFQNSGGKDQ